RRADRIFGQLKVGIGRATNPDLSELGDMISTTSISQSFSLIASRARIFLTNLVRPHGDSMGEGAVASRFRAREPRALRCAGAPPDRVAAGALGSRRGVRASAQLRAERRAGRRHGTP